MRNRLPILALSLTLSGCVLAPAWFGTGNGDPLRWDLKTVESLEEPATLVAIDETVCPVDKETYQMVKPGEAYWCPWRPRDYAMPSPLVPPDLRTGNGEVGR